MADVFISYRRGDRELAEAVITVLGQSGYSVWWDDRLTPVEHWDRTIEQEIRSAHAVLVLWTANSVDSDWVRIEANYAAEHSKLVQVLVGECRPPLAYSMLQRVNLAQGTEPTAANLKVAMDWIAMLVGRGTEGTAVSSQLSQPPASSHDEKIAKTFDDLFGYDKAGTVDENGDLYVPCVLSIAEVVRGTQISIAPLALSAAPKQIALEIPPASVTAGDTCRIEGEGAPRKGGGAGDLHVVIVVRDDSGFTPKRLDLYGDLRISVAEAQAGGEREVALPWGRRLRVRIPAGVAGGTLLRLAGCGLPGRSARSSGLLASLSFAGRGKATAGDLFLKVRIG